MLTVLAECRNMSTQAWTWHQTIKTLQKILVYRLQRGGLPLQNDFDFCRGIDGRVSEFLRAGHLAAECDALGLNCVFPVWNVFESKVAVIVGNRRELSSFERDLNSRQGPAILQNNMPCDGTGLLPGPDARRWPAG